MRSCKVFILFLAVLLVVVATEASACRCIPASFDYRWTQSDSVFVGKVKEVKTLYKYYRTSYDDKPVIVTFDVIKKLKVEDIEEKEDKEEKEEKEDKGKNTEIINKVKNILGDEENNSFELHTSLQNLTCMGYPFEEGKEYLVYAYKRTADKLEKWSLYNYPSETYGVGGLCGGTNYSDASSAEMERIELQMNKDKRDAVLKAKKEE